MDRLRSTSRRKSLRRIWPRALAVITVVAGLAAGGYYISTSGPGTSTSTTTASTGASSSVISVASTAGAVAGSPVATEPVRGGTVRVGIVGVPGSLNLLLTEGDRSLLAIRHLVAAAALRLDPITHDIMPGVFAEVPTLGSGGLTINADGTMTVRTAIAAESYWSDGTAITGADFVRTYDVVMAHRDVIHPDIVTSYDRMVPGSLVVGTSTVEYTLQTATIAIEDLFSVLVPAHQVDVETFADAWKDRMWVSGGPFRFVRRSGATLHFLANSAFASTDGAVRPAPLLDGLEVEIFDSMELAVLAFGDGELNVVGSIDSYELTEAVDQLDGVTIDVLRGPGWEHLSFQLGPGAKTVNAGSVVDRLGIRKAVLATIDRDEIATYVHGSYGEAIESIVAIGWPAPGASVWVSGGEPDGTLTGVTIVLATTGGNDDRIAVAELVITQLEAAGATVELVTDEPGRFFGELILPGEFESAEWAWVSSPGPGGTAGDVLNWFTSEGKQSLDFSRWSTHPDAAEFAALATGLDAIVSVNELWQRLLAAERALAEGVPLIPLYADLNVGAAWDQVGGYRHSALPGGVLATAGEWWLAGSEPGEAPARRRYTPPPHTSEWRNW